MAANTAIYTGADGSLTLSVPQGKEGDTAQALVIGPYDLINVGRVEDVHIEVKSEIHVFNEIGKRYPAQLRAGNITITGSIGRAYVNGALLKLLLGDAASKPPAGGFLQPSFNMTLLLENAAAPGVRNTATLHDVKIENWTYDLPQDDVVREHVDFHALFIDVADEPQ
jgi:hypothetical protein